MEIFNTIAYWFGRGGLVMYLLLAASLTALTIILERARYYRSHWESLKAFQARFGDELVAGDMMELESKLRQEDKVLTNIMLAGLLAVRRDHKFELAMSAAAQLEAGRLRQGLPVLACLVTLSPILGLMGTVIGMIQSFNVFAIQSGTPTGITGGVGEALVATVTGLGVAVLALLGHAWFNFYLDRCLTDMELLATNFEQNLELKSQKQTCKESIPRLQVSERSLAHDSH